MLLSEPHYATGFVAGLALVVVSEDKVWRSKKEKRKWKIKNGKMELRSPHDTETDALDEEARVEAQRRAAVVGVVAPVSAAQ